MKVGKWIPLEDPDMVYKNGRMQLQCDCGRKETALKRTYLNGNGCTACRNKKSRIAWCNGGRDKSEFIINPKRNK